MADAIIWFLQQLSELYVNTTFDITLVISSTAGGLISEMYNYAIRVAEVSKAVAYSVLALFFLLELHKVSLRADGAGSGSSLSVEIVFRVLIKMVLCKMAVDSAPLILRSIYDLSVYLSGIIVTEHGAGVDAVPFDPAALLNLDTIREELNKLNFFMSFLILIMSIFTFLPMSAATLIGGAILFARLLEFFVYLAISPIPIATLGHEEMSQIGKNFLKSVAAVCLQGTLIILVLTFFPLMLKIAFVTTGTDNTLGVLLGVQLYSIALVMGVLGAGKWAKQICNAM